MEKQVKYIYQLSLANGTVLINESEGLYSVNNPENPEDKVLINSAVLIKVVEPEQSEQQESAPLEVELVQNDVSVVDNLTPVDESSDNCSNECSDQVNQ